MFEKTLFAGWGDMDFNSHMRNTAFLDKSVDVRMMFFAENGFPMDELMRRRIGPVVMKDEVEYFKEVRLLDPLRVTLMLAGLADRWQSLRPDRNELGGRWQSAACVPQHWRLARVWTSCKPALLPEQRICHEASRAIVEWASSLPSIWRVWVTL